MTIGDGGVTREEEEEEEEGGEQEAGNLTADEPLWLKVRIPLGEAENEIDDVAVDDAVETDDAAVADAAAETDAAAAVAEEGEREAVEGVGQVA